MYVEILFATISVEDRSSDKSRQNLSGQRFDLKEVVENREVPIVYESLANVVRF